MRAIVLNTAQQMEKMLSGFQQDLGNISGEIKTLQAQSLSMNLRLRNRKVINL